MVTSMEPATPSKKAQRAGIRARVGQLVQRGTPWKETKEVDCTAGSGEQVLCLQEIPLHLPSHLVCLLAYASLLAAFSVHSLFIWATEEPVTTYSTEPASDFAPVPLNISVECAACTTHAKNARKWVVQYDYRDFEHCAGLGAASLADLPSTLTSICRTTDDIGDLTAPRVRLENISEALSRDPSFGRAIVRVSAGDLDVPTPLEFWHEKTLLLGVVANRDEDGCTSASDCHLELGLYLASMQYDGRVTWGGDGWGGALLHIRLLRFAQVYTTRRRPVVDVLASIGGASGLLIAALGALRKVLEVLSRGVGKREVAAAAGATIGTVVAEQVGQGLQ